MSAMARRGLLAILLLLAGLAAAPAAAAGRPVLDWLQYDPDQLRAYELAGNPQDSARQTLTPRRRSADRRPGQGHPSWPGGA